MTITNNRDVRLINTRRVCMLLHEKEALTRQEIAKELALSLPTVNLIIDELQKEGFLTEETSAASSGGRPPRLQSFQYNARLSLGLEITNNHLRMVVGNLQGTPLHHRRIRLSFSPCDEYFQNINRAVQEFLHDNQIPCEKLIGAGIAMPGIVRNEDIEFAPTLQVQGLPVSNITRHFDFPVQIGNEANLAGLAEVWNHRHISDAVFLSLDKGVGAAVLINGLPYPGQNSRAGEIGHMTLVPGGKTCSCGKCGCFEAYCSTTTLSQDLDDFFLQLKRKETACTIQWEEYLDHLATGINNLRMIFDAQIIIGGEICAELSQYLPSLHQRLFALNSLGDREEYVHISRFGAMAPAMGGALLLVDHFFKTHW